MQNISLSERVLRKSQQQVSKADMQPHNHMRNLHYLNRVNYRKRTFLKGYEITKNELSRLIDNFFNVKNDRISGMSNTTHSMFKEVILSIKREKKFHLAIQA